MTEGYPDFQRLSRSGQYQIYYGNAVAPPVATPFFEGYVGNFPFINSFQLMGASTDYAQITFAWYSDSTFTTSIGFRVANRGGNNAAYAQYANLSDWLAVYYHTQSGNPMTFNELSLYGTQQPSEPRQLASHDTAMYSFAGNINASTENTIAITKIIPGKGLFNMYAGATSWFANFNYYDYGSNSFLNYYSVTHNSFTDSSCHIELPILDTPLQFQVSNQDAAARQFGIILDVMLCSTYGYPWG